MASSRKAMSGHIRPNVELIEQARSGDRGAQQEVWHDHRRWVAAIILAHRPRRVEVDDLMQEVALKLVSKFSTLREASAFKPWLRQITINICRGAARNLKPTLHFATGERDGDTPMEMGRVAMPEADEAFSTRGVDLREAAQRLLAQAMSLPPDYREPLLLRCVRSMSYQQISDVLELPVTTIETRLARARRMLREEVGDEILTDGMRG